MKKALFYDESIPMEGERPSPSMLKKLEEEFVIINTGNCMEYFDETFSSIVLFHGSYFYKPFWDKLLSHIRCGKGLVFFGKGTPFARPVRLQEDRLITECVQTAYHEQLGILSSMPIDGSRYTKLKASEDFPVLKPFVELFPIGDTEGFILAGSGEDKWPGEPGSGGTMDLVAEPLLLGVNGQRHAATPALLLEHKRGYFAGGRWIFINMAPTDRFWSEKAVSMLSELAEYTGRFANHVSVASNYASYFPGEKARLTIDLETWNTNGKPVRFGAGIRKKDETVYEKDCTLMLNQNTTHMTWHLPIEIDPGLYTVDYWIKEEEWLRIYHQGFWGYDKDILDKAKLLSCKEDYFYKDGKPLPIVGMTYMQSDVHRDFIYHPNAWLWNRDLKTFSQIGINLVRTGLWTGHRHIMNTESGIYEEILRAFDAFILTAAVYDIGFIVTFFAFTPTLFEGKNCYLDPAAIRIQKRFVTSLVSRYVHCPHVSWDLINEPALCHNLTHWRPVPNGDSFELAAWRRWLYKRHKSIDTLQQRWNVAANEMPGFDAVTLPEGRDFEADRTFTDKAVPLKSIDYILFTQDVLKDWAKEMVRVIRQADSAGLVTVGQDEALTSRRPSGHFYGAVVDYTCNHSWWQNDSLYWDSVFYKIPDKPNLIQETGVMYLLNGDGRPRQNEQELYELLQRKFAMSFAGHNAGAVYWVWNMNYYMTSRNEANIGAIRPDGSQKKEADVFYDFGRFVKETAYLFEEIKKDRVAVIFPYSNQFSVRDGATAASQKLARIFGYHLHQPFHVYGEYQLDDLKEEKLIIIPSAGNLCGESFMKLTEYVRNGGNLLITGSFSRDEYWHKCLERQELLKIRTQIKPVSYVETVSVNGNSYRAEFPDKKTGWVDKEIIDNEDGIRLENYTLGKGKIFWCPVPAELNSNDILTEAVYCTVMEKLHIVSPFCWCGKGPDEVFVQKLWGKYGSIYILVSECAKNQIVEWKDEKTRQIYTLNLTANDVCMFAVGLNGEIIVTYKDYLVSRKTAPF